jgi:GntR family transcriptional repressor for pyruvate dehydrogenase complex
VRFIKVFACAQTITDGSILLIQIFVLSLQRFFFEPGAFLIHNKPKSARYSSINREKTAITITIYTFTYFSRRLKKKMAETLVGLKETCVDRPADKVISKVKELINSGVLKPGDRLPAERKMALDFGFGRTQVREALHKLEFYGIIKTLPQSGSVINGLDINTLDGLISDVLNLQHYDFYSLVETRFVLEVNAIRLCAERSTPEDIVMLEKAHENFVQNFNSTDRVSHDFAFHRAIAEACHNPVFKAMLMIVIPDIMTIYQKDRICAPNTAVVEEHEQMLAAIKKRDGELAAQLMTKHLQGVVNFAKEKLEAGSKNTESGCMDNAN